MLKDVCEMVNKYASEEVKEGIAKRMQHYGDDLGAHWIRNFCEPWVYDNWRKSTVEERFEKQQAQMFRTGWNNPNTATEDKEQFLPKEIREMKLQLNFVAECREFLSSFQNFVDFFGPREKIDSHNDKYVDDIIKQTQTLKLIQN